MSTVEAVVFDMDGVLVDSEPLWRRAEIAIFAEHGLVLDDAACAQTTGLRIDEVVRLRLPRLGASEVASVARRIVSATAELVRSEGSAMPGVAHAIELVRELHLRVALATSSPTELIDATLARLGLGGAFEVLCSAEHETHGKPHPAVYLRTARELGVEPERCAAIEDSVRGATAAKRANMRTIGVSEHGDPHGQLALAQVADVVIPSLEHLDARVLLGDARRG